MMPGAENDSAAVETALTGLTATSAITEANKATFLYMTGSFNEDVPGVVESQ